MGFNTMIACQHLASNALPSPKSSCFTQVKTNDLFTALSLTTLLQQLSKEWLLTMIKICKNPNLQLT